MDPVCGRLTVQQDTHVTNNVQTPVDTECTAFDLPQAGSTQSEISQGLIPRAAPEASITKELTNTQNTMNKVSLKVGMMAKEAQSREGQRAWG